MKRLRSAKVMFKDSPAGILEETGSSFRFTYDLDYLSQNSPVASSLPLREEPFESDALFPFFQGLLPEGWFREIVCRKLSIDPDDEFGLLLRACGDCIGAVWIVEQSP